MEDGEERWLPVVGYPDYEVSDRGRVRSNTWRKKGALMKLHWRNGYQYVSFGKQKVNVHILVARAFIGPRPEGMMVLHWDDDHNNNRVSNLRYGTAQENAEDAKRNGVAAPTWQNGESHSVKLRREDVLAIVEALDARERLTSIAARYGISVAAVSHIKKGKTWAWLTGRKEVA